MTHPASLTSIYQVCHTGSWFILQMSLIHVQQPCPLWSKLPLSPQPLLHSHSQWWTSLTSTQHGFSYTPIGKEGDLLGEKIAISALCGLTHRFLVGTKHYYCKSVSLIFLPEFTWIFPDNGFDPDSLDSALLRHWAHSSAPSWIAVSMVSYQIHLELPYKTTLLHFIGI